MNALIPLYVTASLFLQDRVETYLDGRRDRSRGASLIEYGALIAIVASVAAALYKLNIGKTVSSFIDKKLKEMFK
ncbi:hypothetical protein GCM10009736_01060 [Actinomadura bangladeshensis]